MPAFLWYGLCALLLYPETHIKAALNKLGAAALTACPPKRFPVFFFLRLRPPPFRHCLISASGLWQLFILLNVLKFVYGPEWSILINKCSTWP